MKTSKPCLGVLRLDHDYPPVQGDVACPTSFPYPSIHRMVPGLTFTLCQQGHLDDNLNDAFVEAVRWLEQQGVSGITGDCGFMFHYQALVRDLTSLPVFLSSLVLLPAVLTTYNPTKLVVVFTANSNAVPMENIIHNMCCLDEEEGERRIRVVGCQDVPGFEAVTLGTAIHLLIVKAGVVNLALRIQRQNPNLAAFIFECTQLPPFSAAVRQATGLPVWDAITGADHFIAGCDERPFGQKFGATRQKRKNFYA